MDVRYSYGDGVSADDRMDFERLTAKELQKTLRFFKDVHEVTLLLNAFDKDGKRKKFAFQLKVHAGGRPTTAKYSDWKLTDCVHKVFDSLRNRVAE